MGLSIAVAKRANIEKQESIAKRRQRIDSIWTPHMTKVMADNLDKLSSGESVIARFDSFPSGEKLSKLEGLEVLKIMATDDVILSLVEGLPVANIPAREGQKSFNSIGFSMKFSESALKAYARIKPAPAKEKKTRTPKATPATPATPAN